MDFTEILERFGKLPRVQRVGAIGVLLVLLVGLFWTMVYSPKHDKLGQLRQENEELQAKREQVKSRAENREAFEAELQGLTTKLRQALKELPNDREIPDLLKRISAVARKRGLEIRRFQPLPEVAKTYYAEVPVALELLGSYHEVAMFFDRLSKLGRIVYVQDIAMKEVEERGGKVLLKVEGKAVTFRFLTEEEIAATKAKSKKKKRRKR